MINESLCQVPASVEDPATLKRFLDRLVERLDIVLGYRGDNPAVSTDMLNTAVTGVEEKAEQLNAEVVEETNKLSQDVILLVAELELQLQKLDDLTGRVEDIEAEISDILLELISLDTRLDAVESGLASVQATVVTHGTRLDNLEATVASLLSHTVTLLRDFNDTAWQTAPIYTTFTALGSAILNPPVALVAGNTYTCYVEVRAAYVQKVIIVGTGFGNSSVRAGTTWAGLIANAWI